MIVNISPCATTFDETLHVLDFSAIAKQVSSIKQIPAKIDTGLANCNHYSIYLISFRSSNSFFF